MHRRPLPKEEIKEASQHWCGPSYCCGALCCFLLFSFILSCLALAPLTLPPNMSLMGDKHSIENIWQSPFTTKHPHSERVLEDISLKRGFSDSEYFTLTSSLHFWCTRVVAQQVLSDDAAPTDVASSDHNHNTVTSSHNNIFTADDNNTFISGLLLKLFSLCIDVVWSKVSLMALLWKGGNVMVSISLSLLLCIVHIG